jgi:hypothetical protein
MVPMGPEELLNALLAATDVEGVMKRAAPRRDIAPLRAQLAKQYGFLFDVDEESDQSDFEGTVSQALALLNGNLVGLGSSAIPGSALAAIVNGPGTDEERIRALFLRTVGRRPSAEESERYVKYVAGAGAAVTPPVPASVATPVKQPLDGLKRLRARAPGDARTQAFEDVFWALLNSSEFLFNH